MFTLTKSFHFAAAHRLMHYEWACRFVHGHNFTVTVTIQSENIITQDTWFIIDHKALKPFKDHIQKQYDHAFLTQKWDPIGEYLQQAWHKVVFFDFPPSTELLAQQFAHEFNNTLSLPAWVILSRLYIQETPTAWAWWEIQKQSKQ